LNRSSSTTSSTDFALARPAADADHHGMERTDADRGAVTTAAAEVYEEFFVPALFAQWAQPMLDGAGVAGGDRVVDVGCGTGVLARAAARRAGPDGRVIGIDRNEAMLAVARRAPERVTWRAASAESLPLADDDVDRVVCQFMLMFADDRSQAVHEMARVLAPGGSLALATWAGLDTTPGYAEMVALVDEVVGAGAAEALLAPFALGTADLLRAELVDAFPEVEVQQVDGVACFDSIEAWVHTDVRGWTLSGMIDDATYAELLVAATTRMARFTGTAGQVRFPAPALIATANTRR
jgi:SAM-dependent methyltransferase